MFWGDGESPHEAHSKLGGVDEVTTRSLIERCSLVLGRVQRTAFVIFKETLTNSPILALSLVHNILHAVRCDRKSLLFQWALPGRAARIFLF